MTIKKELEKGVLILDGAMGTMIQSKGLKLGELPEVLNIEQPDTIIQIHREYIEAGAKVITTNTFGANELKLKSSKYTLEEIIHNGVKNSKEAAKGKDVLIALGIGPIGELLEPMGTLEFNKAYNIFKRQIIQGVKDGVDLIIIETMTDLYEAKAAVLAAKENSNLPVFCTMSFESNGRTFTGCTPLSMVMTLQGLNVDALGINCSLGPKEMEPILEEILRYSKVPVMVQANAGLPIVQGSETIYNVLPQEFAHYGRKFVNRGVKIIGGCCGTTDAHILELANNLKELDIQTPKIERISGICTPTNPLIIDGVKIIGEGINPTGKIEFKEAIMKNNIDFFVRQAILQVEAGAHILDINLGLPEIEEEKIMVKVIQGIQSILDIPLQIDSTDPKVIENALRIYNGKAIVNSVNGEDKVLDTIFPIVKKYGAAVIGLTLDENGIPEKAEDRFKIAEKIIKRAEEYGIDREDVYIDCLVLTAAAQQDGVKETLKALSLVKEKLKVKTLLGISNISFGLPNRELINRTFLGAALYAGLDLPIINCLDEDMMETILSSNVLWNKDIGSEKYINYHEMKKVTKEKPLKIVNEKLDLSEIIIKGMKEESKDVTKNLLADNSPLDIINRYLIPALDKVGERYEKDEIFLPQLIQSAETVKIAFQVLKENWDSDFGTDIFKGKILLATVEGDIHDIGKNIVKVLLENYNYEIIDLGKDVPVDSIVKVALENDIELVGLSALMTTTVKSMERTIDALKKANPEIKIMVGGAVLNQDYATMIKADYYAKDAKGAVEIARKIFK